MFLDWTVYWSFCLTIIISFLGLVDIVLIVLVLISGNSFLSAYLIFIFFIEISVIFFYFHFPHTDVHIIHSFSRLYNLACFHHYLPEYSTQRCTSLISAILYYCFCATHLTNCWLSTSSTFSLHPNLLRVSWENAWSTEYLHLDVISKAKFNTHI